MLPLEIPAGTTVRSLIEDVIPTLHGRLVDAKAPQDPFVVGVQIDGVGEWAVHIRGSRMEVEPGAPCPTHVVDGEYR